MKINLATKLLCLTAIIIPTINKPIQIREVRNESTNTHQLIYKNDRKTTIRITNQTHDKRITDNTLTSSPSDQPQNSENTFYIAPLSTYFFDGMTIPLQKLSDTNLPEDDSSKQLFKKLFSDTFIRIEQIRPIGWVGGSHYVIFINSASKEVTLSKQSGSIYYKNWDEPTTYTFSNGIRVIIHHDNQVTLEAIK